MGKVVDRRSLQWQVVEKSLESSGNKVDQDRLMQFGEELCEYAAELGGQARVDAQNRNEVATADGFLAREAGRANLPWVRRDLLGSSGGTSEVGGDIGDRAVR